MGETMQMQRIYRNGFLRLVYERWVDEKQRGNSTARWACPQCNAEYLIVFPKLGKKTPETNTDIYIYHVLTLYVTLRPRFVFESSLLL